MQAAGSGGTQRCSALRRRLQAAGMMMSQESMFDCEPCLFVHSTHNYYRNSAMNAKVEGGGGGNNKDFQKSFILLIKNRTSFYFGFHEAAAERGRIPRALTLLPLLPLLQECSFTIHEVGP